MKIIVYTPIFYGYGKSISDALRSLGHDVISIEYNNCMNSVLKKILCKINEPVAERWDENKAEKLLEQAMAMHRPDLLFVVRGDTLRVATMQRIYGMYKKCIRVIWQNDNLLHLDEKGLAALSPYFDLFLTYDKGDVGKVEKLGFVRSLYLPTGYDDTKFMKLSATKKTYRCDLAFVGKAYRKRVEYLSRITGKNIQVFGGGYPATIKVHKKYISLHEANLLYNEIKIGISMHEDPLLQGVNNRTYEIAGAGCFCLVDAWNDIPDLFEIDKEIVTYNSQEEFIEKIDRYLVDDNTRKKIAENGRMRASSEHTFVHRMKRMLSYIS